MNRLISIGKLREFRGILHQDTDDLRRRIVICAETACQASGSSDIIRVAKKHILQNNLINQVSLKITGCHGFCEMGPFVLTEPQRAFYRQYHRFPFGRGGGHSQHRPGHRAGDVQICP